MIKLLGKFLHLNGIGGVEYTVVFAEPKSGTQMTIVIQNSKQQGIEIDRSILDAIIEVSNELQVDIDIKNNKGKRDSNRVTIVD